MNSDRRAAPGSRWSLATAPDERQRCCVIIDGRRCENATTYHVAAPDGALDDYTFVCALHLELVRGPDDAVTLTDPA